jgi:transposase
MRYELSDYEWTTIKPMLPKKSRGIRKLARQQAAWANIPPKRNRKDPICVSPYLYRARNLIERFFNKIKQCRRVATRHDKLASIRIWLHASESTP